MSGPGIISLGENPLALAESALVLVEADAAAAAGLAERALELAQSQRDAEAQVAALHALSYARHELGDPRAIRDIRAAIRIGMRHGLTRRTALARRRLAMDLADRGRIKAALRELDTARESLDPHEQARSEVFRIGVLWYAGDSTGSLAGADQALRTLRRKQDTFWEAQLLRNRGGLLAERGNITMAEADLSRARDLFASIGAKAATFVMESELARIADARGDLPGCLARLDAIDGSELSVRTRAVHEILRARTLATAHLWTEALEALEHAEAIWKRSARDDHEGRLEVIRLTLLAGDPVRARALALRAQRSFAAQGRHLHAARACGFALAASVAVGRVTRSALRSGRRAAAILSDAGWRQDALRLRLTIARAAIMLGSIKLARSELAAASRLRRHAAVADRVETWHVMALIRLGEGDTAGARQAARNGLQLLEQHRAALGASELRATASATGAELAQLGLRIALAEGRPGALFEWAEALRGNALRLAPVTPPKSPELRDAMTELRQVSDELSRSERGGRSTRTLLAQQARLETQVRAAFRHSAGDVQPSRARPTRTEIVEMVGDRVLAEFVELEGHLTAADAAPRPPDAVRPRTARAGDRTAGVAAICAHTPGQSAPPRAATTGDPRRRPGIGTGDRRAAASAAGARRRRTRADHRADRCAARPAVVDVTFAARKAARGLAVGGGVVGAAEAAPAPAKDRARGRASPPPRPCGDHGAEQSLSRSADPDRTCRSRDGRAPCARRRDGRPPRVSRSLPVRQPAVFLARAGRRSAERL